MEAVALVIFVLFFLLVMLYKPAPATFKIHRHDWQRVDKNADIRDIRDGPWLCYCGLKKEKLTFEELLGR